MKRLLLLFVIISAFVAPASGEKRALIIGVGKYQDSHWRSLYSANDVKLLKEALTNVGFTDIRTLTNEEAKHENIVKALEDLKKRCHADDMVFIHFSGHGQRMIDIKGYGDNEGYIETFVPYDAEKYYSKSYKGRNHLTDYELYDLLCPIQKRCGPRGSLMVSFDACHSNGMSREIEGGSDDEDFRGASNVFGDGKLKRAAKKIRKSLDPRIYSPKIELSACGADEKNYEYKQRGYGSLTYLIYKGLKEQSKNNLSFDRLADYVTNKSNYRSIMTKQTPHRYPSKK